MSRRFVPGYRDNPNLVRAAETSGHDRIAGAALIFKYFDNALFWQSWMHKAPNHFINAVEAAEAAALIPLIKNDAFTGKDFEELWNLIDRYRIQNDLYVQGKVLSQYPLPVLAAKAKLLRTILRCKDLFDTHSYGEFDPAIDAARGAELRLNQAPVEARNRLVSTLGRAADINMEDDNF